MKTVSQRFFTRHMESITEPVEVTVRRNGTFITLGVWNPQPHVNYPPAPDPENLDRPFTPAPKPIRKGVTRP